MRHVERRANEAPYNSSRKSVRLSLKSTLSTFSSQFLNLEVRCGFWSAGNNVRTTDGLTFGFARAKVLLLGMGVIWIKSKIQSNSIQISYLDRIRIVFGLDSD